jgi:hypothetical protein
MNVAETILKQLGGNRFLAMTGAHTLIADKNALIMTLRRNKSKATRLRIELDAGSDTYRMNFYKFRGLDIIDLSTYDGVYNDVLKKVFTKETGFFTSL